ncbi:MAG TPA: PLAT/LH2 domain-containing protein [Acidimicrobiales bacterium]
MADYVFRIHVGAGEAGDIDGADWASEVSLTMFGTKASSPEFRLPTADRSEPGGPPVYRVPLTDLGELQRLRIRHDDTGVGPGCYLDQVVVQADDREWRFVCRQLFSRHDDGATERTFDAEAAATPADRVFGTL